jgi:hypothetical protein
MIYKESEDLFLAIFKDLEKVLMRDIFSMSLKGIKYIIN